MHRYWTLRRSRLPGPSTNLRLPPSSRTSSSPTLKAVFNFRITAPKDWVNSLNGVLKAKVVDPATTPSPSESLPHPQRSPPTSPQSLPANTSTATTTYKPKSKVNSGDIPWSYTAVSPHRTSTTTIFQVTENGLDFFQDLFDYPYPYPKYEQAFVPEYNIGVMENPRPGHLTEDYIFVSGATEDDLEGRTNTICH